MTFKRIVLCGLCFFSMLGTSCVGFGFLLVGLKGKKVRQLAEDYLHQKYTCEMKYLFVYRSFEPGIYRVFFSPLNEPNLTVEVRIPQDLSTPTDSENKYGFYVADDYLPKLFSLDTERFFSPKIQEIWSTKKTRVYISVDTSSMYSFQVPKELNEQMRPRDMETYFKYDIGIIIDTLFSAVNKEEEATNILRVFKIINDAGYKPDEIVFWYKINRIGTEKQMILFRNWLEILTVSNVEDVINNVKGIGNFL